MLCEPLHTTRYDRDRLWHAAAGESLAAPWDVRLGGSGQTITSGIMYMSGIYLFRGEVVTSINFGVNTAGGGDQTLAKVALYDDTNGSAGGTARGRLAVSENTATIGDSTGLKEVALTAAYTVPKDGMYYMAVLFVGGTVPVLARGASSTGVSGSGGITGLTAGGLMSGQTDAPAVCTFTNLSSPIYLWTQ